MALRSLFFSSQWQVIPFNYPWVIWINTTQYPGLRWPLPTSLFFNSRRAIEAMKRSLKRFLASVVLLNLIWRSFRFRHIYADFENGELLIGEVSMDFKGPGYNVSCVRWRNVWNCKLKSPITALSRTVGTTHTKGVASGEVWKWFIDITRLLMIFVLTGVCFTVT